MSAPLQPAPEELEDVLHRLGERLHRIHEDLFLVAGDLAVLRDLIETNRGTQRQ